MNSFWKLQNAKDTYKSVTLEWDVELEDKLSMTGDILFNDVTHVQVRDYKKIEMPVDTFWKHSKYESSSPGVFGYPTGLAIDPNTNKLYICEYGNRLVQVFNKSFEFLFHFSDKMESVVTNSTYVTQCGCNLLTVYSPDGKYLQSVGGKGRNHLEFDDPCGLDIYTELNRIYIAELENRRLHCLNLDLSFHYIIDDTYRAKDVKLTPEEIVVLSLCNPRVSHIHTSIHTLIN